MISSTIAKASARDYFAYDSTSNVSPDTMIAGRMIHPAICYLLFSYYDSSTRGRVAVHMISDLGIDGVAGYQNLASADHYETECNHHHPLSVGLAWFHVSER